MKRVLSMSSLVTVGIGASAAMWLVNKPNRIKAKNFLSEWKRKVTPTPYSKSSKRVIEKGGNPHPEDFEDNNMVSEGAMYSVDFYNEKMQWLRTVGEPVPQPFLLRGKKILSVASNGWKSFSKVRRKSIWE